MITVRKGNMTYYVKDEAIIARINSFQYIAYTVYPLQNRKPFYDFRRAIIKSDETEYDTPAKLMTLAQQYNLKGAGSRKPAGAE